MPPPSSLGSPLKSKSSQHPLATKKFVLVQLRWSQIWKLPYIFEKETSSLFLKKNLIVCSAFSRGSSRSYPGRMGHFGSRGRRAAPAPPPAALCCQRTCSASASLPPDCSPTTFRDTSIAVNWLIDWLINGKTSWLTAPLQPELRVWYLINISFISMYTAQKCDYYILNILSSHHLTHAELTI
jgi:hypothetical protein